MRLSNIDFVIVSWLGLRAIVDIVLIIVKLIGAK